jgi:hypothetical protein
MPYTVEDVARGLGNLRNTIRDDVLPILQASMPRREGGYFIIPREVFAYIDFLGALYSGYRGERDGGRRRIATGDKAGRFIEEIFGRVHPVYGRYRRLAREMFRHGTIHVHRPNPLRRNDGATIEWVLYKGERTEARICYGGHALTVNHLQPYLLDAPTRRYILPLSINTLYDDLLAAIDVYEQELRNRVVTGRDLTLLNNYGETMDALMQPEDTSLNW